MLNSSIWGQTKIAGCHSIVTNGVSSDVLPADRAIARSLLLCRPTGSDGFAIALVHLIPQGFAVAGPSPRAWNRLTTWPGATNLMFDRKKPDGSSTKKYRTGASTAGVVQQSSR